MKRNVVTIFATTFFVLFLAYGGFEIAKVIIGPSLVVITPKNFATVEDPLITLKGIVKRAAYITVNDRQIFADTNGNFSDTLLVPAGYSIIRIEVKDRFEKITAKNIAIMYVSKETKKEESIERTTESIATSTDTEIISD